MSANTLKLKGTSIPGGTAIWSPVFYLPNQSASYNLAAGITADLTNQTGGGNVIVAELCQANGQLQTCSASYCVITLTSGVSQSYSTTCSVPGNVGTLLMVINVGGNITISSGNSITFSQPQVNLATSLAAYQPTVGFNQFVNLQAPSATAVTTGPVLWSVLQSFLPQVAGGTLATSQTAVTLNTSFKQILTSVSSAPTFNFGCSSLGCEPLPGLPSTSFWSASGVAQVVCTSVTTAGTATIQIANKGVSTGGTWSAIAQDGVSGYSLAIPAASGAVTYMFPVHAMASATPINTDYGAFDIQMEVSSGLAPAGACQVVAGSLLVQIWPTDSTVAAEPNQQGNGDKSHLVH